MNKYTKGSATIIILGLVTLLALGSVGYLAYEKEQLGSVATTTLETKLKVDKPASASHSREGSSPIPGNQSISILSPNGGEYLTIGQTAKITWQPGNTPISNSVVSVQLMTLDARNKVGCPGYSGGVPGRTYDCRYYSLFSDVPNTGSISWVIGSVAQGSAVPPGVYYVRVYFSQMGMSQVNSLREQGYRTEDYSDGTFTVVGAVTSKKEVYTNKEFDFNLQYPSPSLIVREENTTRKEVVANDRPDPYFRVVSIEPKPSSSLTEFGPYFNVLVTKNDTDISLNSFIKNKYKTNLISTDSVIINGKKWMKVRATDSYFGKEISADFVTVHDGLIYLISYSLPSFSGVESLSEIINTFKFNS